MAQQNVSKLNVSLLYSACTLKDDFSLPRGLGDFYEDCIIQFVYGENNCKIRFLGFPNIKYIVIFSKTNKYHKAIH